MLFIDFLSDRYKEFLNSDYDFSNFYAFLEHPQHYLSYTWEVTINGNIDILLREIIE